MLRLLAYSLCRARFFALIITSDPAPPFIPPAAFPPKLDLCAFTPRLDLVLDGVPPIFPVEPAPAARWEASLAITFDLDILGFRPLSDRCRVGAGFNPDAISLVSIGNGASM